MLGSSLFPANTVQAQSMRQLWLLFAGVGAAVALLVLGLLLFALARWRRRGDAEPAQVAEAPALEIAWTVAPLLLVGALFVPTYAAERAVEARAPRPAARVSVTAFRWGWTFAYEGGPVVQALPSRTPADAASERPAGADDAALVLPVGETTHIRLTSLDVNHSFWIPAFLFKRDAIPGSINEFDLTPTRLGAYAGRCAQFCGLDHAVMVFRVRVVDAAAFRRWESEHRPS